MKIDSSDEDDGSFGYYSEGELETTIATTEMSPKLKYQKKSTYTDGHGK